MRETDSGSRSGELARFTGEAWVSCPRRGCKKHKTVIKCITSFILFSILVQNLGWKRKWHFDWLRIILFYSGQMKVAKIGGILKKHITAERSPEEILQKYLVWGSCSTPSNNIYLSVFIVSIPKYKPVPGITCLLAGCLWVGLMNDQVFEPKRKVEPDL